MKIEVIKLVYLDSNNIAYISFNAIYQDNAILNGTIKARNVNTKPSLQACKGIILHYLNHNV